MHALSYHGADNHVMSGTVMHGEIDENFPGGLDDGTAMAPGEMEDLLDQVICERDGFDLEEMRAERAVRECIWEEAQAYRGLAPEAWPGLTWNWDFSAKAQRYVYDGLPPPKFTAAHPNGLRLGWVLIKQFGSVALGNVDGSIG